MTNVVILSAKRTPVGSFLGELANVPAPRLGAPRLWAGGPGPPWRGPPCAARPQDAAASLRAC